MQKLSASIAACASIYTALILHTSADAESGNVEVYYAMCACFALIAATLSMYAVPDFEKAAIPALIYKITVFMVGLLTAWAAWSIPNSSATGMLGIVAIMILLPLMGILAVSAVALALSGIAVRLATLRNTRQG